MLRLVFAVLASLVWAVAPRAQDTIQTWSNLGSKEGALVAVSKDAFSVKDGAGNQLDWGYVLQPGFAVKQYRVLPGVYLVHFPDGRQVEVPVKAGMATVIDLAAQGAKPMAVDQLRDLAMEITDKGYDLAPPARIEPFGNALYFAGAPPGVRPPPE
jgi:hypothetical protein